MSQRQNYEAFRDELIASYKSDYSIQRGLTAAIITRGRCATMSRAMAEKFPELRVVSGWVSQGSDGKPHIHHWVIDQDGVVFDPALAQFEDITNPSYTVDKACQLRLGIGSNNGESNDRYTRDRTSSG